MSSHLPSRVSALREKLGRLEAISSKAAEASELSGLRTDLTDPVQKLTALTNRQSLFNEHGVKTTAPESLEKLRQKAHAVRERFRAVRTSATLKKGQSWKVLLAETSTATSDVEKALTTSWRDYRSTLFAGDPPTKVAGTLAGTKENLQALEAYKVTYEAFSRLFLLVPSDPSVVQKAKSLAAELVLIGKRFDFDVIPEVRAFLAAVQAGGAPLGLLTPKVMDWLKEGGGMDSYRVRASDGQ
ncbi:MAG: hypothetical protein JWR84_1716 [Caulobacter sp.]|nr:hypothetical protein [Caulobacter sp.]